MKQHKWHKEIKAWADGAEIECRWNLLDLVDEKRDWGVWVTNNQPDWDGENVEYRIKPQPKEPQYLYVYKGGDGVYEYQGGKIYGYYKTYIGKIPLIVESNDD